MLVEIETAAFVQNVSSDLVELFGHGRRGRHRVLPQDRKHGQFLTWHSRLPADLRNDVTQAIKRSLRRNASTSASSPIIVSPSGTNLSASPPLVTPADGVNLLSRPVELHIENEVSDLRFFLAFADSMERERIKDLTAKGWVSVKHGGGLGSLNTRFSTMNDDSISLRAFVVCDSDALEPGEVSNAATRLGKRCAELNVQFHCLTRRMIENYIPLEAVAAWCSCKGELVHAANALSNLSSEQRAHYNMKAGLVGDSRRNPPGPGLPSLNNHARTKLASGFGDRIVEAFSMADEESLWPTWVHNDGGHAELAPVVRRFLRMLG